MTDRSADWNARYARTSDSVPPPADVLVRFADRLPTRGRALDLACGRAGNGEWLARRGFEVTATDASSVAIESIRSRRDSAIAIAEVRDVLLQPPEAERFDVIVVVRFLERAGCAAIARALAPGGLLFYQTFTAGLSNPEYLLAANELPALFPTLAVFHYVDSPVGPDGRAEASLVAGKASRTGH